MDHPHFCSANSVFDLLRQTGRNWILHCHPNFTSDLKSVVTRAENDLAPPYTFAFFHIADLDHAGHRYGPNSTRINDILGKIDNNLAKIWKLSRERYAEVHFVVLGDHGMVEVKELVDIWAILQGLKLELEKDYLVFLDSTMARFWFFSDHAKEGVIECLKGINFGHVLKKEELDRYHLNYRHNRFGDVLFLVEPGYLIFPNFYQDRYPVKGMHGYAPETSGQHAVLLIQSPRIHKNIQFAKPVDMRSIFPTVLDLLKIPLPANCTLRSLLARF